jgi:uncharacterized protein (TIGR02284 family)
MTERAIASTLTDLLALCKEGEYGFAVGAELLNSDELSILFMLRAGSCRQAGAELQTLIIQYGGKLPRNLDSTLAGQRRWADMRRTLAGAGDEAVMAALERAEQAVLDRYRAALNEDLPPLVMARVGKQLQALRRSHQQINMMRTSV